MGDGLEVFCAYSEKDVLDTVSIEVARNISGTADGLDCLLVAYLAKLAFDCNLFHFLKFLN